MTWQEQIANSYTDISELKGLSFSVQEEKKLRKIIERHPMRITPYYYSLIDINDPDDPIRKMAVPDIGELDRTGTYDTSGEASNTILEGVQHKYATTVLLLSNHRCATYCRYCFRKRMVGLPRKEVLQRVDKAIEYIKSDGRINNILVTGGDPLMLETHLIKELLDKLVGLKQLDFVRIGSRVPVTLPMRISEDEDLWQLLKDFNAQKRLFLVTHFNHPREVSSESVKTLRALLKAGIIVSNQGVLLKGVNDNIDTLTQLMRTLVRQGVQPYYIFQCRPVRGIKRIFQVPLVQGIEIIEGVRKNLDGISKRFRYIMSARSGKLEVLGRLGNEILVKQHQAKNPRKFNRIYRLKSNDWGAWIDDFEVIR